MFIKSFKSYFLEAEATPRKGLLSISQMRPKQFIDFLYQLKNDYKGVLSSKNITIHEKVDGMRLLFGLDEKGKFFIETSYSGPVYPGNYVNTIRKKFGYEPADFTFKIDELSIWLDKNKKLKEILQKYHKEGTVLKVIGEVFYNPLGQITDNGKIRFVQIYYDLKKLGKIATYIILDVKCADCDKDKLIKDLKSISNKDFKIEDNIINVNIDISVDIDKFFKELRSKHSEWDKIITSRKKKDADLKQLLLQIIQKFQIELEERINSLVRTGKFGDEFEGLVFDFPNGSIKTQTKIFKLRKQQSKDKFKHPKR